VTVKIADRRKKNGEQPLEPVKLAILYGACFLLLDLAVPSNIDSLANHYGEN
jgi:hypothetical protein